MADDPRPTSAIDIATKGITVVSLALGVFATWKALPADAEIKRLQAEATRLDLAIKQADADLKGLESSRKVTLELYQEVKNVIEKKGKDPREEDAVRVLVESLADDPFRYKLLKVIAIGAKDTLVKQEAAATSAFYEDEAAVPTQVLPANADEPRTAAAGLGGYNVDFFFCERKRATSEPIARAALNIKGKGDTGRWRVRLLPESINQQPGYGIAGNEIRFTPPDERPAAEALAAALSKSNVQARLRETLYPTPHYISAFVCQ
ncbi:MAG TPA: hypothetical protein VHR41_03180 [Gemmatimonadales bacterium]|jgi:hypothetical protein|nr:hypothetical protein [Gemmatimonadales bacterium]